MEPGVCGRAMIDQSCRRAQMVERQLAARGIADPRVLAAMGEVPRERFVAPELDERAYDDGPLSIGEGQTISQPYIVALMIEAAHLAPGERVLEVGAGSGYAAAVLSRIVGEVLAIERHGSLAEAAAGRIADLGYDNCRIVAGDGIRGLPEEAPFDAIIVAAGGEHVPMPLKQQLAVGGRMVMPVGDEMSQVLRRLTRTAPDRWEETDLAGVRFVPLIGAHGRGEGR